MNGPLGSCGTVALSVFTNLCRTWSPILLRPRGLVLQMGSPRKQGQDRSQDLQN